MISYHNISRLIGLSRYGTKFFLRCLSSRFNIITMSPVMSTALDMQYNNIVTAMCPFVSFSCKSSCVLNKKIITTKLITTKAMCLMAVF